VIDARSERNLIGVHPDLVKVIRRAAKAGGFVVTEGLRTKARQAQLVKAGASRTMNSRHITGHAIDVAAVVNGEVRWDWPLYAAIAKIVKAAAKDLGVPITWGGDWPKFRDGPHFELDRKAYP
jgi:peptidoglycan L-alanyl-D-glutamate endopeptidase CwlK